LVINLLELNTEYKIAIQYGARSASYYQHNMPSVWVMAFNSSLNTISVISWWLVLLVEETGVPGEQH
jgi:hypothetical protein